MRKKYDTDLTDEQWNEIAPLFNGMRKYKWEKRELLDAVFYLVDSGCKWRQLPHDFPPAFTVHSFYRRAKLSGLWDKILQHMVKVTRKNAVLKKIRSSLLSIHKAFKILQQVNNPAMTQEKKIWNQATDCH